MATYTPNYNLSKPEATDDFDAFRASYNGNMDKIDQNMGGGGGGGGHTIVDPDGTDMPQENKLQFTGNVSVSDDSANGQTVVDIEGGGNYYLNTLYSTEEKKVGYWTDKKPLYQKTAYISNITISANSSTNVNISDYFSDVDSAVNFECCDENGNAIFPNVMVNSGLSPYSIGITIDKSADHITFTRGNGSSATISVCLTLWYTKTTDTPEPNPQTGGVIYLPTIYSTEEREIGVWTDGKPLYQKTIDVGMLPNRATKTVNYDVANVDAIVKIFGIGIATTGGCCPIPFSDDYSSAGNILLDANTSSGTIRLISQSDKSPFHGYITIQYTKTTDTAGSGNWNTDGVPTHHYSTNEQVIGTWIDGKPRYEITLSGSGSYSAGSELVVPLPTNADKVVIMGGYVDIGMDWLPLELTLGVGTGTTNGVYCYPNKSTGIHIYSSAWTFSEYNVTVQYCKTTD